MRHWRHRDKAMLFDRKGFVRQAIRSGVPIVPVATVSGHDTVFVLSEGQFLARWTGLGRRLRGATMPIIAEFPFPLAIEVRPRPTTRVPSWGGSRTAVRGTDADMLRISRDIMTE